MYRRYEPPRRQQAPPSNGGRNSPQAAGKGMQPHREQNTRGERMQNSVNRNKSGAAENKEHKKEEKSVKKQPHPITGLIQRSVYNPDTGKVLGLFSAEDLLIVALILLLIDSGDEDEDNSMLIYALIYILISDHVDLPF